MKIFLLITMLVFCTLAIARLVFRLKGTYPQEYTSGRVEDSICLAMHIGLLICGIRSLLALL